MLFGPDAKSSYWNSLSCASACQINLKRGLRCILAFHIKTVVLHNNISRILLCGVKNFDSK